MVNNNYLNFYKNKEGIYYRFQRNLLTNTLQILGAKITGYSLKDKKIFNYKKNVIIKK